MNTSKWLWRRRPKRMNGCGRIESIGLFHQKSLFLIMGDKGEEQPMSFCFLYSVALLECGIRTIPFFFAVFS